MLMASSNALNRARPNLRYPNPRTRPQQNQNVASGSAFEGLQRRFRTTFRNRLSNHARVRNNGAGRPHASMVVTKDTVIIEKGEEKIPSKTEKAYLERSGRVITGLDIEDGVTSI